MTNTIYFKMIKISKNVLFYKQLSFSLIEILNQIRLPAKEKHNLFLLKHNCLVKVVILTSISNFFHIFSRVIFSNFMLLRQTLLILHNLEISPIQNFKALIKLTYVFYSLLITSFQLFSNT